METAERIRRDIHPADIERARGERQRSLAKGLPFEIERRARGKDGTYRWFLFRYKPLLDAAGHVSRWFCTATDIEEVKRGRRGSAPYSGYDRGLPAHSPARRTGRLPQSSLARLPGDPSGSSFGSLRRFEHSGSFRVGSVVVGLSFGDSPRRCGRHYDCMEAYR